MIIKEYMKYQNEHLQKFGENTLVLMEVGSFFEYYAVNNPKTNEIWNYDLIIKVTEILDAGLLGEHILPTMRHAREHLLAPGGQTIPRSATIFATCVSSADLRARLYVSSESLSLINRLLFHFSKSASPDPAAGLAPCLAEIRNAVGLDDGEHYDTTWLHRL